MQDSCSCQNEDIFDYFYIILSFNYDFLEMQIYVVGLNFQCMPVYETILS